MATKFLIFFLFIATGQGIYLQEKPERELENTLERFRKAMIDADRKTLADLTDEKLSYAHSSGREENRDQFIENIASGSTDFISIEISGQSIQMAGRNAIVRQIFSSRLIDKGNPLDVRIGIMMVWHKKNGKWKLLARQGYKL